MHPVQLLDGANWTLLIEECRDTPSSATAHLHGVPISRVARGRSGSTATSEEAEGCKFRPVLAKLTVDLRASEATDPETKSVLSQLVCL